MTLNYGIIGCGMMGQEHLRNIALIPGAKVAAIYEPDPDMRARAAELAPGATMAASLAEVARHPDVTVLLIVSPNYLHLGQLEEIAAIRPLPILCEKPLFTDPADAPRLAALRNAYPAPIWVAMEYRYMPPRCPPDSPCPHSHGRDQDADHPRTPLSLSGKGWRLEPLQPQLGRQLGGKMLPFL